MNRKWVVVGGLVLLFIAVTYSFREGNTNPMKNKSPPKNKQIIQDLEKLDNLSYDIRWNTLDLFSIFNLLNDRLNLISIITRLNPDEAKENTPLTDCFGMILYKTSSGMCYARENNIPYDSNVYGMINITDLRIQVSLMILPDNPTIKMITDAINDLLSFINYLQSTYNLPPTTTLMDAKIKLQQKLDNKTK
jgi:hypothetical protein